MASAEAIASALTLKTRPSSSAASGETTGRYPASSSVVRRRGSTSTTSPTLPKSTVSRFPVSRLITLFFERRRASTTLPSMPETPTACTPCARSAERISTEILPAKTILTTSRVSSSVTRRPLTSRVSSPSRSASCVACAPPPWTAVTRIPTWWSSAISSASEFRFPGSSVTFPDTFTTNVFPLNRRM